MLSRAETAEDKKVKRDKEIVASGEFCAWPRRAVALVRRRGTNRANHGVLYSQDRSNKCDEEVEDISVSHQRRHTLCVLQRSRALWRRGCEVPDDPFFLVQ